MKSLWLSLLCLLLCVMAAWGSRSSYAEPSKAPEVFKMISLDDSILDASQILFIEQNQSNIRIGFRGLPSQGNGAYSVLFVRNTADNWRKLAAATGVAVPSRVGNTP